MKGFNEYIFKGCRVHKDEDGELITGTLKISFRIHCHGKMSKREIERELAKLKLNPNKAEVFLNGSIPCKFSSSSFLKDFLEIHGN